MCENHVEAEQLCDKLYRGTRLRYLDIYEDLMKITYKPHYYLTFEDCEPLITITVHALSLIDSTNRSRNTGLSFSNTLSLYLFTSLKEFIEEGVYPTIVLFEEHEAREWLKYDGQFVKAPVH